MIESIKGMAEKRKEKKKKLASKVPVEIKQPSDGLECKNSHLHNIEVQIVMSLQSLDFTAVQ